MAIDEAKSLTIIVSSPLISAWKATLITFD